jgi:hypothetical protein
MLGIERFPVSAESHIAYEDFSRMHREDHAACYSRWVPPFAMNTSQLRRVLLIRCWRFCHNCTPIPERLDWKKLNAEATARLLKPYKIRAESPLIQKQMHINHVRAALCVGGYLQLQTSIAWQAWRLGMRSVDIAEGLNLSPQCVRINLQRLRDIGRMLGFDCGVTHHSRKNKRHAARLRAAWVRRRALADVAA